MIRHGYYLKGTGFEGTVRGESVMNVLVVGGAGYIGSHAVRFAWPCWAYRLGL